MHLYEGLVPLKRTSPNCTGWHLLSPTPPPWLYNLKIILWSWSQNKMDWPCIVSELKKSGLRKYWPWSQNETGLTKHSPWTQTVWIDKTLKLISKMRLDPLNIDPDLKVSLNWASPSILTMIETILTQTNIFVGNFQIFNRHWL
jgi:hypothetical protein